MQDIMTLAVKFRDAIEAACEAREFTKIPFNRFPRGCCGDASDLMAEFLLDNGFKSCYICGTYSDGSFEGTQSHAWLLVDNRIIVDITDDQFKCNQAFLNYNKPVFVGEMDDFHRLFKVEHRNVREFRGLADLNDAYPRLRDLYNRIKRYI